MSLDTGPLGQLAARFMEDMEKQFEGQELTFGVTAVIAEVISDEWTSIQVLVSDTRRWIQVGLMEAAKQAVIDDSEEVQGD